VELFDQVSLEEVDADGAIREGAEAVISRGSLLRKGAVGFAVLAGGSALAGTMTDVARGASGAAVPQSDIDILNFALTLEYLEAAFYAEAVSKGALSGETLRFAHVVAQHEADHVVFLKKVLGAKAVAQPMFDFKGTTASQKTFQVTADTLENLGVHAYLGQAPLVKTKPVLIGAARILPVEARHAAWIRDIRFSGGTTPGTTPAPAFLEDPFTKAEVLAAVKQTGFIVG
jgi:hypothetical protein